MKEKITKSLLVFLLLAGIAFSVANFTTPVWAKAPIWGGVTELPHTYIQSFYWYAHLYGDYFCLGPASNCVIVYGN